MDTSGDCWLWQARCNAKGYGNFAIASGNIWLAHRYSWTLASGPIPKGMYVCHRCDNPPCVNPDHLFLGDQLANMHDSMNKGRFITERRRASIPRGTDHYMVANPEKIRRGEQAATPKLTETQVKEIRTRYNPRKVTLDDLATEYGITFQNVWMIVKRKTWTHI